MPRLHEAISSSHPNKKLSTGTLLPGRQSLGRLASSFLTCRISNNFDGIEDMLISDSILRGHGVEEDDIARMIMKYMECV